MNRYVTWVHLPKKKMAHWERLGEFSLIVAGGLREGRARRMKFLKRANHTAFSTMATMSCQLTVLLCEHDKKILQPCFDSQLGI